MHSVGTGNKETRREVLCRVISPTVELFRSDPSTILLEGTFVRVNFVRIMFGCESTSNDGRKICGESGARFETAGMRVK